MKLQNQYANAPITVIVIKPITIKFSVTYGILLVSFKGIHTVFSKPNSKFKETNICK